MSFSWPLPSPFIVGLLLTLLHRFCPSLVKFSSYYLLFDFPYRKPQYALPHAIHKKDISIYKMYSLKYPHFNHYIHNHTKKYVFLWYMSWAWQIFLMIEQVFLNIRHHETILVSYSATIKMYCQFTHETSTRARLAP